MRTILTGLACLLFATTAAARDRNAVILDLWAKTCGSLPTKAAMIDGPAHQAGMYEPEGGFSIAAMRAAGIESHTWFNTRKVRLMPMTPRRFRSTVISFALNDKGEGSCSLTTNDFHPHALAAAFAQNIHALPEGKHFRHMETYAVTPTAHDTFTKMNVTIQHRADRNLAILQIEYPAPW